MATEAVKTSPALTVFDQPVKAVSVEKLAADRVAGSEAEILLPLVGIPAETFQMSAVKLQFVCALPEAAADPLTTTL